MFIGEVSHAIDSKGRYIVPARFRDELGEEFYITKGLDHCLFVYTAEAWQAKIVEVNNLSSTNANARRFMRNFFAGALAVKVDKQYRVLLTPALRDHANIKKDILTIGVANRLEIWDQETWDSYNQVDVDDYEAVAEQLADIRL